MGVVNEVQKAGDGVTFPKVGDKVSVHYTGTLEVYSQTSFHLFKKKNLLHCLRGSSVHRIISNYIFCVRSLMVRTHPLHELD